MEFLPQLLLYIMINKLPPLRKIVLTPHPQTYQVVILNFVLTTQIQDFQSSFFLFDTFRHFCLWDYIDFLEDFMKNQITFLNIYFRSLRRCRSESEAGPGPKLILPLLQRTVSTVSTSVLNTLFISTILLNITLMLHTLVLQLLPHVLLQDAVLVANVMPHDGLPVRQVPTLALRDRTVEGF